MAEASSERLVIWRGLSRWNFWRLCVLVGHKSPSSRGGTGLLLFWVSRGADIEAMPDTRCQFRSRHVLTRWLPIIREIVTPMIDSSMDH